MVVIVGLLHEYTLMVINSANKLDLNLAQSNLQAKGAAVPLASLLGIIFLVLGCSFVFISWRKSFNIFHKNERFVTNQHSKR
jgi:ABC-type uncharacterized transport system permease subunit